MNITVDDSSPQISYNSFNPQGWFQNVSTDAAGFYGNTLHSTKTDGDAVTYRFNGSAIYVFGSKRRTHGIYSVQLDGGDVQFLNGFANQTSQACLFAQGGLDSKEHVVTLTNLPSRTSPPANSTLFYWLDVDFFLTTTAAVTGTFPFGYSSATFSSGWSQGKSVTQGDLTFPFTGSSLQMYGAVDPLSGNYSVSVDGATPQVFDAQYTTRIENVPLFTTSGLTNTPHTLKVVNVDGKSFTVSSFTVNVTGPIVSGTASSMSSSTASVSTVPSIVGDGSGSSKKYNVGAIAGGVVGGVLGLAALILLYLYFRRRQNRPREVDLGDQPEGEYETKPLPDNYQPTPFPASANGPTSVQRYTDLDGYDDATVARPLQEHERAVPLSAAETAALLDRPVRHREYDWDPDATSGSGSGAHSPSVSDSNYTSGQGSSARPKSFGVSLPYTSLAPPAPQTPVSAQGPNTPLLSRRHVEGREQDYGPVLLPPDYHQATEPLPGQVPPPSSEGGASAPSSAAPASSAGFGQGVSKQGH